MGLFGSRDDKLRTEGIRVVATIRSLFNVPFAKRLISDRGPVDHSSNRVRLTLAYTLPDGRAFETERTIWFPRSYQPDRGEQLPICVDPNEPSYWCLDRSIKDLADALYERYNAKQAAIDAELARDPMERATEQAQAMGLLRYDPAAAGKSPFDPPTRTDAEGAPAPPPDPAA